MSFPAPNAGQIEFIRQDGKIVYDRLVSKTIVYVRIVQAEAEGPKPRELIFVVPIIFSGEKLWVPSTRLGRVGTVEFDHVLRYCEVDEIVVCG